MVSRSSRIRGCCEIVPARDIVSKSGHQESLASMVLTRLQTGRQRPSLLSHDALGSCRGGRHSHVQSSRQAVEDQAFCHMMHFIAGARVEFESLLGELVHMRRFGAKLTRVWWGPLHSVETFSTPQQLLYFARSCYCWSLLAELVQLLLCSLRPCASAWP